jgi:hypothetical protein
MKTYDNTPAVFQILELMPVVAQFRRHPDGAVLQAEEQPALSEVEGISRAVRAAPSDEPTARRTLSAW